MITKNSDLKNVKIELNEEYFEVIATENIDAGEELFVESENISNVDFLVKYGYL